ncbi:hypothetical protein ACGFYU_09525 [Streptomyces sp. NPDC048337]|uniref:hypothetical protein n=1 Tax=Streptomyces sp. NPDC048337 TaxID=3365535 RepID=UPI003724240A
MVRVQTVCPDCKRCTNSAINEGGRKAGRVMAGLMTAGLTEVGRAATRNCRGCGHAMSLHGRADNARYDQQATPQQGAAWGAQAMPQPQPQPDRFAPRPHTHRPPTPRPAATPPVPEAAAWRPDATTSPAVISARLARLDALLAIEAITADEHARQRAAIISVL